MLKINGLEEGLEVFKTLGSEVRLRIVKLLSEKGAMNLNEIADALDLTNGALTAHIRKLEESGIINIVSENTGRGNFKVCSLKEDSLYLDLRPSEEEQNIKVYETDIRIGHYGDYSIQAPCGLAGRNSLIGEADMTKYFAYPEHLDAELLWFHNGYVEYRIPNLLPANRRIVQIMVSFEISSAVQQSAGEAPSQIEFVLCGEKIGRWHSFEEPDNARGIYTPSWWGKERQHGFLKMIVVNEMGTFLDGRQISEKGFGNRVLTEYSDLRFRFQTHETAKYKGGLALYGKGFGNYKQDIRVQVHYMPDETAEAASRLQEDLMRRKRDGQDITV